MSWVRVDDCAFGHPKLLAAGAQAAWLWVCGLSYCNGQKRRDGFIPLAKVALLYPGVGVKQAKRLVDIGLWEEAVGGYLIHDYHEYQPSDEFSWLQSARGAAGGSVRSEAKRQAAIERESRRRIAQAESTTNHKPAGALEAQQPQAPPQASPVPSRPVPSQPDQSPERARDAPVVVSAVPPDDPGRETPCPLDLEKRLEESGAVAALAEKLASPIDSIRHEIRQFVAYWTIGKGAGQKRTGWPGKARQWVVDKHGKGELIAPGAAQHAARKGNGRRGDPDDDYCAPSPMLALMPGGTK